MLKIEKLKILVAGERNEFLKKIASSFEVFHMTIDICDDVDGEISGEGKQLLSTDVVLIDVTLENSFKSFKILDFIKSKKLFRPKVFFVFSEGANCVVKSLAAGADGCYQYPLGVNHIRSMLLKGNNPENILWGIPLRQTYQAKVESSVSSLENSGAMTAFGRGGFSFTKSLLSESFNLGDVIGFKFELIEMDFSVCGKGVVVWDNDQRYGVEFRYLNDSCRIKYIKWLESSMIRPYIPK